MQVDVGDISNEFDRRFDTATSPGLEPFSDEKTIDENYDFRQCSKTTRCIGCCCRRSCKARQGKTRQRGIGQARVSSKSENHVLIGWFKYIQVVQVVQRRAAAAGPGSGVGQRDGCVAVWMVQRERG